MCKDVHQFSITCAIVNCMKTRAAVPVSMMDERKRYSLKWSSVYSYFDLVMHLCEINLAFQSRSSRAATEKPKGPNRRSSRAEKEVEEEPVVDSGIRKRSVRPGTAAVKGNVKPSSSFQRMAKETSLHLKHKNKLCLALP